MNEMQLKKAEQDMENKIQNLPKVWDKYKSKLKEQAKISIGLTLAVADDLPLWQSKIGGKPYMPKNMAYPTNKEGKPLYLLAQINFDEMPTVDNLPDSGILQFFIASDDVYGLNFDSPQDQDNFRVIYHDVIIQDNDLLQQDLPTISAEDSDEGYFPVDDNQYAITPELQLQTVCASYEFDNIITNLSNWEEKLTKEFGEDFDFWEEVIGKYEESMMTDGHRIGGYPYFTQFDPRENDDRFKDYILLFQLDSDDVDGGCIMWGDCGVGNFFIHPDDLAKRDFSKVMYNWDCC